MWPPPLHSYGSRQAPMPADHLKEMHMATLVASPPNEIVWNLANAVVASRSLQVVADLGVADQIDTAPVPVAELARVCGLNADALDRVMRLLTAHGVFEHTENGYAHSDASRLLRADNPTSMRAFAQLNGLPGVRGALGALEHSLRTGAPGWEVVDPRGFFPYLLDHPDELAVFERAMSAKGRFDIDTILGAYDFAPFRTIADIGGGRGHLLQAVLNTAPHTNGVLFELSDVVATLDIASDRLRVVSGDFFSDALPAADCYVLMEVIHDWTDEQATRILQAVRRAAAPGATVLIIEDVAPDEGIDARSQTLDVLMLDVTGGRERTSAQLGALLRSAGIRRTRTVATAGAMRIVEGVAV